MTRPTANSQDQRGTQSEQRDPSGIRTRVPPAPTSPPLLGNSPDLNIRSGDSPAPLPSDRLRCARVRCGALLPPLPVICGDFRFCNMGCAALHRADGGSFLVAPQPAAPPPDPPVERAVPFPLEVGRVVRGPDGKPSHVEVRDAETPLQTTWREQWERRFNMPPHTVPAVGRLDDVNLDAWRTHVAACAQCEGAATSANLCLAGAALWQRAGLCVTPPTTPIDPKHPRHLTTSELLRYVGNAIDPALGYVAPGNRAHYAEELRRRAAILERLTREQPVFRMLDAEAGVTS